MKQLTFIICFLLIITGIRSQVKVTFDKTEAKNFTFHNETGHMKIKMVPDSETHFQVTITDKEGNTSIYSCYSKKEEKIKIDQLEELRKWNKIVLDGIAVTQGKDSETQSVYTNGYKISEKEFKNHILFSETSYNKKDKSSLETVYYPSGERRAIIQSNEVTLLTNDRDSSNTRQISIQEYYESGNIKRSELMLKGNLVKKEHFTSTGQDTIFALPFMRMPQFPGGEKVLMMYLQRNLKYPMQAIKENKSGRSIVKFIVDKNGEIRNPVILRSSSYDLDKEALRIVKNMPKWEPGVQYGEAVEIYFSLPIRFKL